MKTLINRKWNTGTYNTNQTPGIHSSIELPYAVLTEEYQSDQTREIVPSHRSDNRTGQLLTAEAAAEMQLGHIPDLAQVCHDLYKTFYETDSTYSALQFIPILKQLTSLPEAEVERFLNNPKTNHVLVQNDLLKVVLIHWKPGKFSSIHGHAPGGCVFKVLKGKVVEKRYSPDAAQELLAVSTFKAGGMAYIDDEMALHAVGNAFDEPAISLHVYPAE